MDEKECIRGRFRYMPTELPIGLESFVDQYATKKRTTPRFINDRKKFQEDILYVKNPIFNNLSLRFRDNRPHNCEFIPINSVQNVNVDNDNFLKVLSKSDKLKPRNLSKKNRKDRMKARAENRRDSLFKESSDDEDYSPINSCNDLKSANHDHKNYSNMDEAFNRRSRSARTERYFRRLSREDSFHENDSSASKVGVSKKIQDARLHIPHPIHYNNSNNRGERSANLLFFNQDNTVFNNPIYNTSRGASETLYNQFPRRDIIDNKSSAANMEYKNLRRSDPGSDAILAYKKCKSPRIVDRVQYIEPKLYNYQQSQDASGQNKPSVNPNRIVKRSFSFQSETPKEYESRINASLSLMKPSNKSGNNNHRNERRWIDSIASSTSTPTASLSSGDFQRKKLYQPKAESEVKVGDKNLTKTNYDEIPFKKRSSKDLGKGLSELEKMYTSLRLSDDNLLERAEERCVEEFSLKGQSQASNNEISKNLSGYSSSESIVDDDLTDKKQSSEAHVKNDDMAYRKMQTKKMPALSETQNSLSQISYLLASSALILEKTDYPEFISKTAKEEPNITKDDMVYRNLNYANKVLKVVEPQPPFGIPLRPATPSTNSNYLCSSPVAIKSPPLKFVPQAEPNIVTDDLAFRNLRKDAPKTAPVLSSDDTANNFDNNVFLFKNELLEKSLTNVDNEDNEKFFKKKRKAVRSLSANLYGLINEVKNLDLNIK